MSRFRENVFAWWPVKLYRLSETHERRIDFIRWAWLERVRAVQNFYEGWIHFEVDPMTSNTAKGKGAV